MPDFLLGTCYFLTESQHCITTFNNLTHALHAPRATYTIVNNSNNLPQFRHLFWVNITKFSATAVEPYTQDESFIVWQNVVSVYLPI